MKFPKHKYILTICLSILALTACVDHQQKEIDLSGKWSFKIDSTDVGETEYWFTKQLDEVIQLPGSMAENGKGNDITVNTNWTGNMWNDSLWYKDPKMAKYRKEGNVKVPFWLTPVKDYKGAAWYQKTITIPENWKNKQSTEKLNSNDTWNTLLSYQNDEYNKVTLNKGLFHFLSITIQ